MNLDQAPGRPRLDAALVGLAVTFRGMTARPDENNCECHWGSAQELALLKVPDVELDLDLLRRTWGACDWDDHASVLRRILPQLATALVNGQVETYFGLGEAGRSLARGEWQQWPAGQAAAVREFLEAWWTHSLTDPDPVVAAYEVLALCVEASGTLSPWLKTWEALTHPMAGQCLAEAVARWEGDLLRDELPWDALENQEDKLAELSAWLVRHAPAGSGLRESLKKSSTGYGCSASAGRQPGRPALAQLRATEPNRPSCGPGLRAS
jgi:hypothetical protein